MFLDEDISAYILIELDFSADRSQIHRDGDTVYGFGGFMAFLA